MPVSLPNLSRGPSAALRGLPRAGGAREWLTAEVSDLELCDRAHQEGLSSWNLQGLQADDWTAFFTYKVNHSLPVISGPLASGNYSGYHPQAIANSYRSALWKQMNLDHQIKRYDPKNIPRDRIVGCIIGVQFPPGMHGAIPASREAAPALTCIAAVFKQAEGVDRMIGQHLSSKRPWSISSEVEFQIPEAALYQQSTGKMTPIMEAPDEMWAAVTRDPDTGRIRYGKYNGDQLIICPGGANGSYQYQGVGFTATPAEREAYIEEVRASRVELADGRMALCASAVPIALFQSGVWWLDGLGRRVEARVLKHHAEGTVRLGLDSRQATAAKPVLHVRTKGGLEMLRSVSSIQSVSGGPSC